MKTAILATALVTLILTQSASASFLQRCTLTAKVESFSRAATFNDESVSIPGEKDTFTRLIHLKILTARTEAGSHTNCTSFENSIQTLMLKTGEKYTIGQALDLEYSYYNGRAPGGMAEGMTWLVK